MANSSDRQFARSTPLKLSHTLQRRYVCSDLGRAIIKEAGASLPVLGRCCSACAPVPTQDRYACALPLSATLVCAGNTCTQFILLAEIYRDIELWFVWERMQWKLICVETLKRNNRREKTEKTDRWQLWAVCAQPFTLEPYYAILCHIIPH